jgi:hypothetical protein
MAYGRWISKRKQKRSMMLAFNEVAKLDRVMYDILDAMTDVSDLSTLPAVRWHLLSALSRVSCLVPRVSCLCLLLSALSLCQLLCASHSCILSCSLRAGRMFVLQIALAFV